MSWGEIAFLAALVAVGIGYGVREYAVFIATYRNPSPPFPYPPERLWRRLKLSALIVLEALLLGLTLAAARGGRYVLSALLLAFLTLALLVRLILAALADLRETRAQHRDLLEQARQAAAERDARQPRHTPPSPFARGCDQAASGTAEGCRPSRRAASEPPGRATPGA